MAARGAMHRSVISLVLLAGTAFTQDGATPRDDLIRTTGEAVGLGPAARHEAAQMALKALVVQQLENWVPSRNLAAFAPLIDNASEYVTSYEIIRQETTEESTKVEVEARLNEDALRRIASGLALEALVVPARIAITGNRCADWDDGELPLITATLAEALDGHRFEQASPQSFAEILGNNSIDLADAGELQRACQAARGLLADMVVCAQVEVTSEPLPNGGLLANRATVTVKIVRALDGREVREHEVEGLVHSLNAAEGGKQAVLDACAKLPETILRAVVMGMFMDDARESVFLTIENPGTEERVDEIAAALKRALHIDRVDTIYASDSLARLKVRYGGPIVTLADYFADAAYSDFNVNTRTVIDRDMTLEVRTRS